MNDKHFIFKNIHFTQRYADKYVDATQICQSQNKMFANWFRLKSSKQIINSIENSLYKTNRHTWIHPNLLPNLITWVSNSDINFEHIQQELDKPFENQPDPIPITHKVCSKCHENLPIEKYGKNKLKVDGYDIRCKNCYKEDRELKSDHHTNRSLEYYNENKESCNARKSIWNKNNKEKVNEANKRAYEKRKALKNEEKMANANIEAENILQNMTLMDKNNKPYTIVCRESDGYIDITNLCKAGGKKFNDWYRLTKSKDFLRILDERIKSEDQKDMQTGILTSIETKSEDHKDMQAGIAVCMELIKIEQTSTTNKGTWVHPKIAINIAQWISPSFDLDVAEWVHQLLILGYVKLTDKHDDRRIMDIQKDKTKHNRLIGEGKYEEAYEVEEKMVERINELERINKEWEDKYKSALIENNRLNNYLERKRRIQFDKGKVVYILKHKNFKDVYKIGSANDLTSRVSTANTHVPDDFDMLYYIHTMYNSTIELMMKKKLVDYLYAMNREWYEAKDPQILIDNIKKAVEYFEE
jgi:hypothetical protein